MGARKFHGITAFRYSADASAWTSVTNIVGNQSGVVFEDEPDDAAKDPYGNSYRGPNFRVYTIAAIDRTAYGALQTAHAADTEQYFEFTLDNGEVHVTDIAVLFQQCRPVDIEGVLQGRSNVYQFVVRINEDNVTETIA